MLLGVIGNPPKSESQSLRQLLRDLTKLEALFDVVSAAAMDFDPARRTAREVTKGEQLIRELRERVNAMQAQVGQGVHVNGRGHKMSDHVQAIVYIHEKDGQPYVHGFGDAPLDLSHRAGALCIRGLEDNTDVQMFAESNGSLRIVGRQGQPLWEDHD